MRYIFTLYDPIKNVTKEHKDNFDYKDYDHMYYQWFDGNFSCDCNKKIFMYNDSDFDCGNEIQILQIKDENGNVVYTNDLLKYTLCKTENGKFFIESKEDNKNKIGYHRTDVETLSDVIHIFKDCNDSNMSSLGFQVISNNLTTTKKYEKQYEEVFSFSTTKELEDFINLNGYKEKFN